MTSSPQKVLNKITQKFTEGPECCWTCFLQMLRGTEQRQLKTDVVSLQFDFITVLNSRSTSIRHHGLVIERINSPIKTRLDTLYFASHPSSSRLLTSKITRRQLDAQKPVPLVSRTRATLRAGMLMLAGLPPRLLNAHFSQSASDQKCRQWKPIQPLRTAAVAERGLCRYMKEAFRRRSHSREAEREPPVVSGYLLLAWKGGGRRGKVSGQMENKLSKIRCSTSKQKQGEFKLKELSSISFSLVIYCSEEKKESCFG